MNLNKREIGNKLEYIVAQILQEAFNDTTIRPSKASGASTELGDIRNSFLLVECKKRNTKSVTINNKVWNHLLTQLPINSKRVPLLVLENKEGKQWAVMDLNDLQLLLTRCYNATGEIQ
jgi:Holliday junction resolvase